MNIKLIGIGLLPVQLLIGSAAAGEQASMDIASANNAFALEFYQKARGSGPNLVFSPYSISAAFGMTYAGAEGATAEQMRNVMHWSGPATDVARGFQALNKQLDSARGKGGLELAVANSLWPQEGYQFRPEFTSLLKNEFNGAVFTADFRTKTEAERTRINAWVGEKTRDRIKDLIPPGALTPLTRLVLCNAIYFKGQWEHAFPPKATSKAQFRVSNVHVTSCDLMRKQAQFGYAEQPGFKILSMPYKGRQTSMVVLLPDEVSGLAALEQQMSAEKLSDWLRQLRQQEVQVFFPKFVVRFGLLLNKTMSELGMVDAFTEGRANFSGMNGAKDFYISAALHKAFVEVNEEGTEAAAATGVIVATRAAINPKPIPVFRADHPFVYLIRHGATGAILFLGRFSEPEKS